MSISPYKTKSGKTLYRVRYTRDDGTRSDKRGFQTKAAARKYESSLITGEITAPGRNEQPLHTYADLWLATLKGKAPGTIDLSTIALKNHVLPRWGHMRPSDVKPPGVQRWITENCNSEAQATRNLRCLKGLLLLAGVRERDLPTIGIKKPAKSKAVHNYLTFAQLTVLANATRTEQHRTIIFTLGLAGMRWGELAGLRTLDYHADTRTALLRQNATIVRGRLVLSDTLKTGKSRRVIIPGVAGELLERQAEGRGQLEPILPGTSGGYMLRPKGNSWYNGALKRAQLIDPTIPTLRLHDLRHTAASLMVATGAHVKLVQTQLGHASAAMTLDVYSDLFPEDLGVLRSAMDAKYCGQNVGTAPVSACVSLV